jgi:predicted nucleotidyltransferase
MSWLPRDFVTTAEGLVFAVVDYCDDEPRIPCFLRYRSTSDGSLQKLATSAANALLSESHPKYLYHCERRQAALHGVRPADVIRHLRPRERVRELLGKRADNDPFEARAARLVQALAQQGVANENVGITGSLLAGCHRTDSDIDLAIYDEAAFRQARDAVPRLIRQGVCTDLDEAAWADAYRRRGCALDDQTFRWHEARKYNKALFEGTKFDLSLITDRPISASPRQTWRKLGVIQIRATVDDDRYAFHFPARLGIDHPDVGEVLAFTATYTGQARTGERIEVQGQLEQAADGRQRIVVGSDRESAGQSIRVLGSTQPGSGR